MMDHSRGKIFFITNRLSGKRSTADIKVTQLRLLIYGVDSQEEEMAT